MHYATSKTCKLFYVYVLSRPDGRPFYVGKGKGQRIFQHEWDAQRGIKNYKCNIIRKIWREGREVHRSIVFISPNELDALHFETTLIHAIGRPYLANQTKGGDGIHASRGKMFNKTAFHLMLSDKERAAITLTPSKTAAYTAEIADIIMKYATMDKLPGPNPLRLKELPLMARRKAMIVYLSPEEKESLERISNEDYRSMGDMIRHLIRLEDFERKNTNKSKQQINQQAA